RHALRGLFWHLLPILPALLRNGAGRRLVEKTASNCFRLGYVNEVFPDAKIVYPLRDARNNVNSLINAWLHPTRFFTYDVPEPLDIAGYPHRGWKFVLPPGWRAYTRRPLEEVCAFQWRTCHESMLGEIAKPKYEGRVLRLRLEDLVREPERRLRILTDFLELPYDDYFRDVAIRLPVVNSPDNDPSQDKWQRQNRERVEKVLPMVAPMMERLGYES
ncbi:MAG: sulfotransferase family protein, partial [Vicinamibacteria bacterium]